MCRLITALTTMLTTAACTGHPVPHPPPGDFTGSAFTVPVDYSQPDGQKLKIAMVKLSARDSEQRLGTLIMAPGGPGDSGVDFVTNLGAQLEPLRQRYDIIGLDPRGTGRSSPIDCMTDSERDSFYAQPVTADFGRRFAAACERQFQNLIPFVGTENAARDLESLRIALGEDKLNYYGFSYGTRIGLSYLEQFPERAGRFVLDSIDNPKSKPELDLDEAPSRLENEDLLTEMTDVDIAALLTRLHDKPIPAGDGREVNDSVARAGLFAATSTQDSSSLMDAIAGAERGDGQGLQRLADEYNGRNADGSYTQNDAYTAITCLVGDPSTPDADVARVAQSSATVNPIFGAWLTYRNSICEQWPVRPTWIPRDIQAPSAPEVLLLNNSADPVTPLADARSVHDSLANSILVTHIGTSHGVYLTGSTCVNTIVNTFFTAGSLPPADPTCG